MPASRIQPIVITRYAQGRLYDAANQRYVSPDQLREWATCGVAFVVLDKETGINVTDVLLA